MFSLLARLTRSLGFVCAIFLIAAPAHAVTVPQAVSLGGELFLPDGSPVIANRVNFRIQVYDAAQSCVLYSENQLSQDLSRTNGRFNLILGTGSGVVNNVGTPGMMDAKVFANPGLVSVANCATPQVALNAGDQRMIRISYDIGSGYVALSPDVPLVSSAYAMVADSLSGKTASDFLQIADNGSTSLNQANADYTFSSINWPRLKALLDGNSNQYLPTTPTAPLDLNGQRITDVHDPVNPQDVVTKNYADTMVGGHSIDLSSIGPMTGNNNTLLWDATANKWVAGAVNTSPTGAAGGDLTGTYPNPTIANDAITAAKINATGGGTNRLLITDPTTGATIGYGTCGINEIYAWTSTGWACTTVTALSPVTSVAGRTGAIVLNAGDIGGLGTAALYDWGTAANQILRLDGSARIPAVDGSLLTRVNAVQLQSRDVANIAPTTGQILGWNGTAWVPVTGAAGSVTNVGTGNGLVGGSITTAGTISVDTGTIAQKILQLNASAQIPAVDGSLLYNVKIGGNAVATTAPFGGTVLGWNTSANQWEPIVAATGSVQSVGTGNGLIGGPITTNGTISVDTGTTGSKILQLNSGAQIPAVDASLLYNVNASKLATRTVSSAMPTANQVLGFNATTTQWEPQAGNANSVTNIQTGNGVLGGPITSTGTISIDAGTSANKILQLNSSALIPAVDGSLLYNINATKLATRTVSSAAPGAGQVLGFNVSTTQWEPTTASTGSVQSVNSGVGLTGGPITTNGTLNVDVGTSANKILQLNSSALIPAVDGSLLYNVKLGTRTVSTAGPVANQVLGWNATTTQWEPQAGNANSVTNIQTGNGVLGGPITSTGTISIDAGTTANKILQLNPGAQIPAVDASLLYNVNASKLATRTVSSATPVAGQVLGFNVTTTQWEPTTASTGSVQSVNSGTGLTGGPITTNGTLNVDVGTSANKILQLNSSALVPAVDGSLLYNVNASKIATRTVSSATPLANQVLGFNATTTQWEPQAGNANSVTNIQTGNGVLGGPITSTGTISIDSGTTANKILQLNSSALIPAVDGSLLFNINATKLATRTVSSAAPGVGQVLGFNVTTTQWEPTTASTGSVQSVNSGTGLTGGPITVNGTLNVDVGTTANKIMQLDGSAKIPAVDASQLYNVNASKIATRTVSSAMPTANQVLGFNATTTQWEPQAGNANSVTNIQTGNGVLGGPITSTGTISIDSGTTANKILQLNTSALIPAVDGSLLYNVNATKLATRTVSSAAPVAGQVLGFNVSTTQWEPTTASTGSVQSVNSGVGLTGGPITTNGTLNVDVGTTANKILQLNSSALIPAVDGSLLYNVKLGTRTVSTAGPVANQVLGWNATTTQWEPQAGNANSVTNIQTGNGVLGGPITSTGTISIDAGTTANKILQLNTSALIPAVDGSLLYNINATKLATRTVSSAAPGAGQVLGFNVSTTQWEPTTASTGSVQSVNSGVGLTGGPITTNGTLNVDVGTTANKIMQLDPSAKIPAVDASQLYNVNASKIATRTVSSVTPLANQVLGFNATTTQWEPQAGNANSVTNIQTGNGVLGGPITSTGTISIDAGTSANKILQLNASALIPAVDGSLLYNINATKLATRTVSSAAPSAGQVLGFNVSTTQWEPVSAATGSVTSVNSGTGLTGGPITSNGTLNVDVGTTANKIMQLDGSAKIPAVDASQLYNVNASKIATRTVSSATPTANQVLGFNATTTQWEPQAGNANSVTNIQTGNGVLGGPITSTGTISIDAGTTANKILQLNSSALIPAVDGSLLYNINATKLATRTVSSAAPGAGQVLGFNVTTTQWEPTTASTGSVQSVNSGTGLTGGPITTNGTLNVDVGTTANKIMQLDSSARVPAVDASQLYNVNASKIATRTVSSATPTANQVLGFNATTTQWEPQAGNANSVTNIQTGNGVLGGPITSTGTISIDSGTAANKILQLNSSAQIPAVDGSLLYNVNATKLATRTVSSATPTSGQVLGFNVTTTQWEPVSAATGSVTSVNSGTGLTGGPITSNGTLNVDVGTTANKIMQLDPSAKIPAVDASQLYNVNASKIATRTVSSATPLANQVLGFNATTTQWEPQAGNANSVTNIQTGNGVLGGPITSTGTISIDAGTSANKILQLNPSALIPAVDGSLLYNINATKLATRAVSSAAPSAGQVLGFNVTTTQWEPVSAATGSVTSVNSGTGLTGGPITSNGTLNVDVGTSANKILQLNPSALIPAVDGSLLYNVNASKIATRAVSSATPTANQVLGFNATTTQWEPQAGNANSVTNIATGNGVLGGPITSTGTISIDAGTTANKILQLNTSALIPAVDGSLLYNINATKLATRTVSSATPTAGQVLGFNVTTTQWEPTTGAAGSVTSVNSGTGLTGGPITSNGTLNVDVGTTANKILQLNSSALVPAVDGSLLYNINASKIGTRPVSSATPNPGQVLAWNATTTQWMPAADGGITSLTAGNGITGGVITSAGTITVDVGTTASKILQLDTNAKIPAVDASQLYNVNATKIATRTVSSATPTSGQVLGFNVTTTQWEPTTASAGSVQSVNSGTGLTGGPITSNGTLNVDVGTTANKILQLDTNAKIPAVDASQLYNVNATKIATRTVSNATPTSGQVLGFNVTTTQWEPVAGNAGSVTNIGTGNGILGGPITSTGTISIDSGTTANKILQLNSSALLPAVDGSLLYNVNASKIGTRTISTANPGAGQALGWNATTTQWEPISVGTGAGSVTQVNSGVGLTGGPITSNGTLNVDVGTTANKIVQLNPNAQLAPAVGTVALPSHSFVGNASTGMYSPGANQLGFATSGTAALTIVANGYVGINSTSPGNRLDILDGVYNGFVREKIQNSSSGGAAELLLTNDFGQFFLGVNGSGGIIGESNLAYLKNSVGGAIALSTSGTERFRVGVNGNIGINTNAPAAGLDIATTGTGASAIIVPRDTTANRPSAPVNGMLRYNNTLNAMEGYVNNAWSVFSTGSASSGVTSILASTGLLGGTITSTGTISVDVGTAASKIVQLNTNSQIGLSRGTAALPAYSFGANTNTGVFSPAANQLAFSTAGTSAMVIDVSGNVGLGTATPLVNLDVVKTQNAPTYIEVKNQSTGAAAEAGVMVGDTLQSAPYNGGALTYRGVGFTQVSSAFPQQLEVRSWSGNTNGLLLVAENSAAPVKFATNDTERMRISSAGNVAIGTTLPASGLDIATTGTGGSAIIVPRDTTANRPSNAVNGMLRYNNTLNAMEGYVNGAWSTFSTGSSAGGVTNIVASTGLLGGTITSTGTISVDVGSAAGKIVRENANAQIAQLAGSVALPSYSFSGNTATGMYSPNTNQLALATSGTAAMTIIENGNVGIGTSAPTAQLMLSTTNASGTVDLSLNRGSAQTSVPSTYAVNDEGRFKFYQTDGSGGYQRYFDMIATGATGGSDANIRFFTNTGSNVSQERMRIDGKGNVGLGTAAPLAALDVYATGTAASAIIVPRDTTANRPSNAVAGMIRYNSTTSKFEAYEGSAWTNMIGSGAGTPGGSTTQVQYNNAGAFAGSANLVWDNTNGRLGINSATPAYSLDVTGNLRVTTSALISGNATVQGNLVAPTLWGSTSNSGTLTLDSTSSTTKGTIRLAPTGGNVGIGTTSPTSTLDVYGTNAGISVTNTNAGGNAALYASAYGTGTPFVQLNQARGTIAAPTATQQYDNVGMLQMQGWSGSTNVGGVQLYGIAEQNFSGTSAPTFLAVMTTNTNAVTPTEKMRVTSGGNVGIGSQTPQATLDVNGAIVTTAPAVTSGTTIDFSGGNLQYTSQSCGAFTLNNMKNGGSYTLAVQGTSATTCSFTAWTGSGTGSLTVKMPPDHQAAVSGKHTLYAFTVLGSFVYVSWVPGY